MKKLMILAAAVAAMAACTKSEVVYDDNDTEIALAPVNYMTTKTAIYGPYQGAQYQGPNDTYDEFQVWAWYTTSRAGTDYTSSEQTNSSEYLDNVKFGYKDNGEFGGTPDYYWPKSGSLVFAGYTPSGATVSSADYNFATTGCYLTLTDFEQGDYKYWNGTDWPLGYKMVDLMYFDVEPTSKTVNGGVQSVSFKHALSWISFELACTDAFNELFKITEVTLNGVKNKETFTSGAGVSGWRIPQWTANSTGSSIELYKNDAGKELKNDDRLLIEGLLLIPQDVPTITIKYEQRASEDEIWAVQAPEIVKLAGAKENGEGSNVINKWEINKHYRYTLTLSADPIRISPKVSNWDEVVVSDIPVK